MMTRTRHGTITVYTDRSLFDDTEAEYEVHYEDHWRRR